MDGTTPKKIATRGLFCWFVSAVDQEHPFYNCYFANDDGAKDWRWWNMKDWKSDFDEYVRTQIQLMGSNPQQEKIDNKKFYKGPFMLHIRNMQHENINRQLLWFYKSYWHWGGNNMTLKKPCDPDMDVPVPY